jgi:hypothetical protein
MAGLVPFRYGEQRPFRHLTQLEDLGAPAVEPVTLAEVWAHLRLDPEGSPPSTPQDALLSQYIATAREMAEARTATTLCRRRRRALYRAFPEGGLGPDAWWALYSGSLAWEPLALPAGPASDVVIRYYDEANQLQTLDPARYIVAGARRSLVSLLPSFVWPATFQRVDAVQVEYTAGYGAAGSPSTEAEERAAVPARVRTAILFLVQSMYDNPPKDERDAIERMVERMLGGVRVHSF